jgi:hypothetical protein
MYVWVDVGGVFCVRIRPVQRAMASLWTKTLRNVLAPRAAVAVPPSPCHLISGGVCVVEWHADSTGFVY